MQKPDPSVLGRLLVVGVAAMLVASLSAIAVVRADNRTKANNQPVAAGNSSSSPGGSNTAASSDNTPVAGGSNAAAPTGVGVPSGGATSPSGGATTGAGGTATKQQGGAAPAAPAQIMPSTGKDCPDYNPNLGVFCDHYLIGGTTVLSGPLAVYGDQGLKGGLAWITYYNSTIAPRDHLRQAKLVWYNDDLDPNKCLQYVQRLNEVDKVLYLSGITSPEAASKYIQTAKIPLIGDLGLSPKSYVNPYIFATSPSEQLRDPLRIKLGKQRFGIKSFAVIQDVLPSVDTGPLKGAWTKGADQYGVKQTDYVEIASTSSDCSGQFSRVIQSKPEYLILPTASGVLLACLREARKFSVQPNGPNSPWLKGWTGGSNLQVEVDNCKPLCEGMLSIGTIFADPRTSNTPEMTAYRNNMAKYAPNVDITGFIAINYYHGGSVVYNVIKHAGIQWNLNRDSLIHAAEHFGPFDTGFGNTVTWGSTLPREPWNCLYPVVVKGDKWIFESEKTCV
ncbi:MAG: branched-chain amino acid transport system substrate-binding protein [Actinomycetota bacterium]|jgi:ABC-type branched-subunit amino acid transport system substrate-binding protein|nr:branched-chain amino acid transport system substrate-binding protein [Actinomycetota bacterium]